MLTKVQMSQNYLQNSVFSYTYITQYGRNTLEIHIIIYNYYTYFKLHVKQKYMLW